MHCWIAAATTHCVVHQELLAAACMQGSVTPFCAALRRCGHMRWCRACLGRIALMVSIDESTLPRRPPTGGRRVPCTPPTAGSGRPRTSSRQCARVWPLWTGSGGEGASRRRSGCCAAVAGRCQGRRTRRPAPAAGRSPPAGSNGGSAAAPRSPGTSGVHTRSSTHAAHTYVVFEEDCWGNMHRVLQHNTAEHTHTHSHLGGAWQGL